jgi:hypothetical protein
MRIQIWFINGQVKLHRVDIDEYIRFTYNTWQELLAAHWITLLRAKHIWINGEI